MTDAPRLQAVTLVVDDLARSRPDDAPVGPRTASFADPDGHVWEIAS